MSDPVPNKPWYIALLEWLAQFIKDNWSGLAVLLWSHEEKKVESVKQDMQTSQMKEAETANENAILKEYAGKSDADIIDEFASTDPSKPPTKPGS